MRKLFQCFIAVAILASVVAVSRAQERGRVMPSPQLKCDRNDLTLYDGRVVLIAAARKHVPADSYHFATTENVTLRHRGTNTRLSFI